MWGMKKMMIMVVLLLFVNLANAQTWDEWFKQKSTQKKYLIQQIAALKEYSDYALKGYAIVNNGLNTIRDIKDGDFHLHDNYFISLISINPTVKRYAKIVEIVSIAKNITTESSKLIKACIKSHQFSKEELSYLKRVFNVVLMDCANVLDQLSLLSANGQLSMNDDERITGIDNLFDSMINCWGFTKSFCNNTKTLLTQRENEQKDIIISKKLIETK